jgi:hypothetical protein
MYEVKVEGLDALLKNFDTFGKQLEELHKQVPAELVEWQRVDMRRQYPNITVDQSTTSVEATTMIWPRSRLEQQPGFARPRAAKARRFTGPKQVMPKGAGRVASTRPILRTELFTKLIERMGRICSEAMKWP